MEQPSPHLTRNTQSAFTLVELLIALTLVSVVMALAWMVLDSTRKVTEEIGAPVTNPVEQVWSGIQYELDRLLPDPQPSDIPGLQFTDDTGLELVSLVPGPEGIPLQTELHYQINQSKLLKISIRNAPPLSQTNVIAQGVTAFRIRGHKDESEIESWPPEEEKPLPSRLSAELQLSDGSVYTRDFHLPASFRAKTPEQKESIP